MGESRRDLAMLTQRPRPIIRIVGRVASNR